VSISKLHEDIEAVCPIHGVSVGDPTDKQTWTIHFKDEATGQEQTDAQAVVDGFDWDGEQTKLDNIAKHKKKAALKQAKTEATDESDTDAANAIQAEIDALG
jgi:hypothetical protein